MPRYSALFSLLSVITLGWTSEAYSGSQYRDVGTPLDFDSKQSIYFDHEGELGNMGWPSYWDYASEGADTVIYEGDNMQWWSNPPPPEVRNAIGARVIRFHHHGRFRVKAAGISADAPLFLTLRFKDDIIAPSPVLGWNGSDWTPLGEIGGSFDHRWKTTQISVPAGKLDTNGGTFVFTVGGSAYSDKLKGELPIDSIKLGNDDTRQEFPADAVGVWPDAPASNFSNLGDTMEFIPGEGPFFPLGVYDHGWVSDGGSQTSPGNGATDMWKILQDAGMNCYVIIGWEQEWESKWTEFPNEPPSKWAAPGIYVELGLKEHLLQARAHGLKVIPFFATDGLAWWIKNHYGGEQKAVDRIGQVMAEYKDDPNVLMWYPVDEWDHEDPHNGRPHVFSHILYAEARKQSPQKPNFMLSMGFNGPDTWRLTAKDADVLGVDVYPSDSGGLEKALKVEAKRLDDIRSVVGRTKPYIMVPELYQEGQPTHVPQDIIAQSYLAIIHGARGILYFQAVHPRRPDAAKDIWAGPKQVSQELFGNEGLAATLLPPSTIIDMMSEQKVVDVSDSSVHTLLVRDKDGRKTLITMNISGETRKGVKLGVKGLDVARVETRFEGGRTVDLADGSWRDDYAPFERHVYNLGSDARL
jgi:hypothetical protein